MRVCGSEGGVVGGDGVSRRNCYLPTCFVRRGIIAQSKLWYYLRVVNQQKKICWFYFGSIDHLKYTRTTIKKVLSTTHRCAIFQHS